MQNNQNPRPSVIREWSTQPAPIYFPSFAYTGRHFDAVYDERADILGYRPPITIAVPSHEHGPVTFDNGWSHMIVTTDADHYNIAREIVAETIRRENAEYSTTR